MSLDDLFMPPIYIDGTRLQRVAPLGPWPEMETQSASQRYRAKNLEACRARVRASKLKKKLSQ